MTTNATTAINDTTAQLNGYVDANGKDATAVFDYGTTTAYGMTSAPLSSSRATSVPSCTTRRPA